MESQQKFSKGTLVKKDSGLGYVQGEVVDLDEKRPGQAQVLFVNQTKPLWVLKVTLVEVDPHA